MERSIVANQHLSLRQQIDHHLHVNQPMIALVRYLGVVTITIVWRPQRIVRMGSVQQMTTAQTLHFHAVQSSGIVAMDLSFVPKNVPNENIFRHLYIDNLRKELLTICSIM